MRSYCLHDHAPRCSYFLCEEFVVDAWRKINRFGSQLGGWSPHYRCGDCLAPCRDSYVLVSVLANLPALSQREADLLGDLASQVRDRISRVPDKGGARGHFDPVEVAVGELLPGPLARPVVKQRHWQLVVGESW